MKTFKQFQEETRQLDEALPLIPAALSLGGKALAAYSAYSAGKNLAKGNYKQAAFDAIGAIPGGKAFKLAKGLGASKNIARGASAAQSIARYSTPNAFAKGVDKTYDLVAKGVGKIGNLLSKDKNKKNKTNTNTIARTNSVPNRILGSKDFVRAKNPDPAILGNVDKKRTT